LRTDLDLIEIDYFQGGYILAQHLLNLGCRRIGFMVVPIFAPTVKSHHAGAREAILEAGIDVPLVFFEGGKC
jgi:LacI family transcriptional regulator